MDETIDPSKYDCVLASERWTKYQKEMGDFLMTAIEKGKTVVQVLYNNSQDWKYPKGKFPSILIGKHEDGHEENQEYVLLLPNNPLFMGSPKITAGSGSIYSKYRLKVTKVSKEGNIDVVANWKDGVPLAAIRKDLNGLIISLGFFCGQYGTKDGIQVVINALRLVKY